MLITFEGRKSGRTYRAPVRYITENGTVRAFTSKEFKWWRNMRTPISVRLKLGGKDATYKMVAVVEETDNIQSGLLSLLEAYPQDAPYYEIRLEEKHRPLAEDIERAATKTVMLEAELE